MPPTRPIEDTIRPEFLRGTDDNDYNADDVPYDNGASGLTATEVQAAIDEIVAAGAAGLTVEEQDGTPSVAGVTLIKFDNGTVTDETGGVISVTNSGGGGSPTFKGVLVTKSSTQNVADSSTDVVTWANVIRDDDSWADLGTNNDRLTAPYDCAVEIFAMGFWNLNSTDGREMIIDCGAFGYGDYSAIRGVAAVVKPTHVAHCPYIEITTGTDVKLFVAQYSGGTLSFGPYQVDAYLLVKVLELL